MKFKLIQISFSLLKPPGTNLVSKQKDGSGSLVIKPPRKLDWLWGYGAVLTNLVLLRILKLFPSLIQNLVLYLLALKLHEKNLSWSPTLNYSQSHFHVDPSGSVPLHHLLEVTSSLSQYCENLLKYKKVCLLILTQILQKSGTLSNQPISAYSVTRCTHEGGFIRQKKSLMCI